MQTFKKYCRKVKNEDSIYGEFASDVLSDREFPRPSRRDVFLSDYKHRIVLYLVEQHACQGAMEIFCLLWDRYIKENT